MHGHKNTTGEVFVLAQYAQRLICGGPFAVLGFLSLLCPPSAES